MSYPEHLSHSQINTLFECGEKYRLQKVAHAPSRPAWWFVSGSAFHRASELFDRALFKGVEWSEEEIQASFDTCWNVEVSENREIEPDESLWSVGGRATKAAPNRENGEYLHEQGRIWIANYRKWRLEDQHLEILALPDGEPAIEVTYMITVAGIPVKGGVDRVFVSTETGIPLIVDHKTGSKKPENDDQLSEYGHALRQLFGLDTQFGAYYMAREARLTDPIPLSMSLGEFEKAVRGADLMRQNKIYVPHKTARCKTCPVAQFCSAVGGARASEYQDIDE